MRHNVKNIFVNRNLFYLWFTQLLSQGGDSIFQIGLLWLVLDLTGSESITGFIAMSAYLPALLFALFAGVVADRFDRKIILRNTEFIRFVVILLVPLLFYFGKLTPVWLGVVAFLLATSSTFFNPSRDALIPTIVPNSRLIHANSLIQTTWQFSLLLGPAIAAALIHWLGIIHLFTATGGIYLTASLLILLIRSAGSPSETVKKTDSISLKELTGGISFSVNHPVLLPLLLITIADNLFIMGPAIVGTPVLIKQVFHSGAQEYAMVQSAYAVGMLIGTLLLLKFGKRFHQGKILLTGMMLDGLTFIPIAWIHSIRGLVILIVIHSLAIPMLTVSRASLIQKITPAGYQGRVFALVNLAVIGMSALSSAGTGIFLEMISAPRLFFIVGWGGALCGIVGWFSANRLKKVD